MTGSESLALEQQVAEAFSVWVQGLAAAGLRQERRPLRVRTTAIEARISDAGMLEIAFELPPGAYATAVLRELINAQTTAQSPPRLRRDFSGLRSSR